MPSGYLVTLGDYVLDTGDDIVEGWTSFTTDTVLGTGNWIWSGTWNGSTFTNESEPGSYELGTDGNVYFIPDFGQVDTLTDAEVTSAPAYTSIDGVVVGTNGDELIDDSYVDAQGDSIDDGNGGGVDGMNDTVQALDGNDTVLAGLGDDVVFGGSGDDSLEGGSGNDTLEGGDEQDTLRGNSGDDSLDGGGGDDDLRGNQGNDTLIGGDGDDTLRGGNDDDRIEGGIGSDVLRGGSGQDTLLGGEGDDRLFGNAGNDSLTGGLGSDSLVGGSGDDTFQLSHGDTAVGGDGDDTFFVSDLGESISDIFVTGGEGDETNGDILNLGDLADVATFNITNADDASGGYSGTVQLLDGTIVHFSQIEDIQDSTGTSILPPICFTPGTLIMTAQGMRPIETLSAGDMVLTQDNGLQPIRWIGSSEMDGTGEYAPILLTPDALEGAARDLLVSPQHRFLMSDWRTELLFGEQDVLVAAKHMVNGHSVTRQYCETVTYVHMMLDSHQIVFAENVPTESFYATNYSIQSMDARAREAMFMAFPHLRGDVAAYGDTARRCLRGHEARLLMPANNAVTAIPGLLRA